MLLSYPASVCVSVCSSMIYVSAFWPLSSFLCVGFSGFAPVVGGIHVCLCTHTRAPIYFSVRQHENVELVTANGKRTTRRSYIMYVCMRRLRSCSQCRMSTNNKFVTTEGEHLGNAIRRRRLLVVMLTTHFLMVNN